MSLGTFIDRLRKDTFMTRKKDLKTRFLQMDLGQRMGGLLGFSTNGKPLLESAKDALR